MIDLHVIWFVLLAVLLTGYAILDGYDLGVGVLHLLARGDRERRLHLNAIGPVWDGNEVWLLTGGGALFAAFPIVYATVFSGFYLAMMLVVLALIFRAVSLEFRSKVESPRWRAAWDLAFGVSSTLAPVLFGVAVGNILQGIPLDRQGNFTGSFLGLLNPFALLVGVLTLVLFTLHGALYLVLKTEGELHTRTRNRIPTLWVTFLALYAATTVLAVARAPFLFARLTGNPLLWLLVALLGALVVTVPLASLRGRDLVAFLASCGTMVLMIALAGLSLFPRLVPSSTDLAYSLTIYNASSSQNTLTVMLCIALIGMPLVIAYTGVIHWIFRGKVVLTEESY